MWIRYDKSSSRRTTIQHVTRIQLTFWGSSFAHVHTFDVLLCIRLDWWWWMPFFGFLVPISLLCVSLLIISLALTSTQSQNQSQSVLWMQCTATNQNESMWKIILRKCEQYNREAIFQFKNDRVYDGISNVVSNTEPFHRFIVYSVFSIRRIGEKPFLWIRTKKDV